LCVIIWGLNFVAVRIALREGFGPLAYAGIRFPVFGLALLAVTYALERDLSIRRRHLWPFIAISVLGVTIQQVLWTEGMARTLAPKGSILMVTSPVFAALFAPMFREAWLPARGWLGVLLALAGAVVIVGADEIGHIVTSAATLGDVLILAAAAIVGAITAGAKPFLRHYSALKYTSWYVVIGSAFLLPPCLPSILHTDFAAVSARAWIALAYSIVFAGVTGFWLWFNAVEKIGATRTAIYQAAMPIAAVIGTAVFLQDEMLTWVHALGAAVTIVGVWIVRGS
jgi:drug/metabolite transporter (DMT)-like permease